ncbi:MAG: hypothetical protein ACI9BF_000885 [Candidatus Paceibacteria bacterium]|jgi:hypothetical protein
MPPVKVFIFIGAILFILLLGFFLWEPGDTKEVPCSTELHAHGEGPEHCDP